MPTVYGSWVPNSTTNQRMRLVLDYSVSNTNDTTARVTWSVRVEARYGFNDSDNTFTRGGSWPAGGRSVNINVATNGSQVIESNGADATREYGGGTRTLSFSLTGINYVGVSQTATVSATVSIPARPVERPNTPSISVVRVSDNAHTINWSITTSAARPVEWNWYLDWMTMSGNWARLGTPGPTTRSWPSQSQQPNRAYRYRIAARNSGGQSDWATSGWIYNTPSAATGVSASRSGSSMVVSWTVNSWSGYGSNCTQKIQLSSRVGSGSWSSWADASGHTGLSRTTSSRTITGLNQTRQWRARVVTMVPGRTSYSSASGGVELYDPPSAPSSATVTRESDTAQLITWSHSPTSSQPVDRYELQRWSAATNQWATSASSISSSARSYRNGTGSNSRYRYRIRAVNGRGASGWTYTPYIRTSPLAANNLAVSRTGTTVSVQWSNRASHATSLTVQYQVQDLNGAWGSWTNLSGYTGTSPTTSSASSSSLPAGQAYRFRIITYINTETGGGGTLSSTSSTSPAIGALIAPNAPTPLAGTGNHELGLPITLRWRHNPRDGSAQTHYQIRYRAVGTSTWETPTAVTSTESQTSLSTTGLLVGDYEWQVRTRGASVDWSPWSSSMLFWVGEAPLVSIVEPENDGTVFSNVVRLTYLYTDPQDAAMQGWSARLTRVRDDRLIQNRSGAGSPTSILLQSLDNGEEYEITLTVESGTGLSSSDTIFITAEYLLPSKPEISATWSEQDGMAAVTIANVGARSYSWVVPESAPFSISEERDTDDQLLRTNYQLNPSFEEGADAPIGAEFSGDWSMTGEYSLYVPPPDTGFGTSRFAIDPFGY